MNTTLLLSLSTIALVAITASAELRLDHQRNAHDLGGEWSMLLEQGDQPAWQADVADGLGPWQTVRLPASGLLKAPDDGDHDAFRKLRMECEGLWLRRTFSLTAAEASRDSVLKWGGIRFGAKAWINGTQIADHAPMGPNTVLLPENLLHSGENTIVLRVHGWGGVPMSKSGYPLIPAGGNTQSWGGKNPAVHGDIWLEFYDDLYLREVLAMPDLAMDSVRFRVRVDGMAPQPREATLRVDVLDAGTDNLLAFSELVIAVSDSGWRGGIPCTLTNPVPWTPKNPHLYEARVRLQVDGKTLDELTFRFGMREISVKDGHFRLNGKSLWLRGSNLLHEWLWDDKYNDNVVQYLVEEARAMSLNGFRTHTDPPPTLWADTADEHGMIFLAEMPLLYNHGDFGYTPEELKVLHENTLEDTRHWITKLWNHPSILIWVLSNESRNDNAWESGPLFDMAKALDPTRLFMRTGESLVGTPDMLDVHTCFNVVRDAEGTLIQDMTELMKRKDPQRPLCNTEYMNWMWDASLRWLGKEPHPWMRHEHASIGMEHTEAMRRLGFDCLLPYMYAGWTRLRANQPWREDFPSPMAAALHSSMSPVLASLDLFDRNHVVGESLVAPLVLINEEHADVEADLVLYLTREDPLLVPDEDVLTAAVWSNTTPLTLAADSMKTVPVSVSMPEEEGTYYLSAVLRRTGHKPVTSQRIVRAIDPTRYADEIRDRRVMLLGGDDSIRAFLDRVGCEVVEWVRRGHIDADVAILANPRTISHGATPGAVQLLRDFAEQGGRVIVLNQEDWWHTWKGLAEISIGLPDYEFRNPVLCSRAHRYEGVEHPVLRDLPADWLWRWNGLPGEIVETVILESPAAEQGKKLLWASRPDFTALLSVPIGKGELLFCQLRLRQRLAPGDDRYDPAAERLMINMLRK